MGCYGGGVGPGFNEVVYCFWGLREGWDWVCWMARDGEARGCVILLGDIGDLEVNGESYRRLGGGNQWSVA